MITARTARIRPPHPRLVGAAAILLLTLVVVTIVEAGDAAKGPALPAGTVPAAGAPPYSPDQSSNPEFVRDWCRRATDQGRELVGTSLGGDLLYAAAHAYHHLLREREVALALYAEAAAAYPRGDPMQAQVQHTYAVWELGRGNTKVATEQLANVEAWARVRRPADLEGPDVLRWDLLARLAERDLPMLRAKVAEAHGRFAEAAEAREELAESLVRAGKANEAADRWEEAARLRHRAGDREGAARIIDEALGLDLPGHERAWLELWRVYLNHGLLREDGSLGLWSTWPGKRFERDVKGALRGLQGHPNAGTLYLSIASGAFTAGRKEFALDVYELALGDRDLQEQARGDESIWRGLLVAFPTAVELGRFEQAEHILGVVERIADEPIPEMDDYRIGLQRAREAAKWEETRKRHLHEQEDRAQAEAKRAAAADPRTPLGTLGSGDASPDLDPAEEGRRSDESRFPVWGWIFVGVFVFTLVNLLVRRIPRK